jgi:hypothetical protein
VATAAGSGAIAAGTQIVLGRDAGADALADVEEGDEVNLGYAANHEPEEVDVAISGNVVLVEDGEVICDIPLPLAGGMSNCDMEGLMKQETELRNQLFARGYGFNDPIYTLLFLSSTHLPYIRITPRGIYDVMNKTVLFPSIMR